MRVISKSTVSVQFKAQGELFNNVSNSEKELFVVNGFDFQTVVVINAFKEAYIYCIILIF